jgi:hypothetical protein
MLTPIGSRFGGSEGVPEEGEEAAMWSRFVRIAIALACASAWSTGVAGAVNHASGAPASPDGGWTIVHTPDVWLTEPGFFQAVSCPTLTSCTAVWYYDATSGTEETLAEHWNGASWAVQPTPNPAGSSGSYLDGVSCATAASCTAVGYSYGSSGGSSTLVEQWNGTSWSIQTAPSPTGAMLDEVSCFSTTSCTAIGRDEPSSGTFLPLAEHWNGTSWSIQPVPAPSGAKGGYLAGVSCSSATSCTAVGGYETVATGFSLAEHWNGTSWSIETTPSPPGASSSELLGVSCAGSAFCMAAGDYTSGTGAGLTFAEQWNGTRWSATPISNRASAYLYGAISCPSTTSCTATGTQGVNALADYWNGSGWSVESTPLPKGAQTSELLGVSCPSTTACTAVGNYVTSGDAHLLLSERWNATSWAIQPAPDPSAVQSSELEAVSCATPSSCAAIGNYYVRDAGNRTLAEQWSGTAWAIEPSPNPSDAVDAWLSSVSCRAAGACTAVGDYFSTSAVYLTLAERWNGTAWAIESTPNPAGAGSGSLEGVSCPSAISCTAVGAYLDSSGVNLTLAERWNGASWSIEPTPNPSGAQGSDLSAVSCTSATACTAVGSFESSAGAQLLFAERWNGTSWTIQAVPIPTGTTTAYLQSVSCPAATVCTAVGDYSGKAGEQVLAERWDGTSWLVQPTPVIGKQTGSALLGVSCASVGSCTAAGNYRTGSVEAPLAEYWNGTAWAVQLPPDPVGSNASQLTGVSCPSPASTMAVGVYVYGPDVAATLGEHY